MPARPIIANATGSAIIDSFDIAIKSHATFRQFMAHWSPMPTTAENLTIKVNSILGSQYDTVIYSVDPATKKLTDDVFLEKVWLLPDDVIEVRWNNTNASTYGIVIMIEPGWT